MPTYRADDNTAVTRWFIDEFEGGRSEGHIFEIREDGDLIYINPARSPEFRLTREHLVVLAQDVIARYPSVVIVREPDA